MSRVPGRYVQVPRAYYLAEDATEYSESETEAYQPQPHWTPEASQYRHPPGPVQPPSREHTMHEKLATGSPDVTEIYRRKAADDRYLVSREELVMPEEYYYHGGAAVARMPQQRRMIAPVAPQQQAYYASAVDDNHPAQMPQMYDVVYHSTPHLHRNIPPGARAVRRPPEVMPEGPQSAGAVVRAVRPGKPQVTVRTPRYYRRQTANIYKRPSTLCLPLSCQPDPGLQPRVSRTRQQQLQVRPMSPAQSPRVYPHHAAQMRAQQIQHAQMVTLPRSAPASCETASNRTMLIDEERLERIQDMILERKRNLREQGLMDDRQCDDEECNEIEHKNSELDMILSQYQHMFNGEETQSQTQENVQQTNKMASSSKHSVRSKKSKHNNNRMLSANQLLKPRLPPSLRGLQNAKNRSNTSSVNRKNNPDSETSNAEDETKNEIQQLTATVLDNLLLDLDKNGLIGQQNDSSQQVSARNSETRAITSNVGTNTEVENNPTNKSSREHVLDEKNPPERRKENTNNYQENPQYRQDGTNFTQQNFTELSTNTTFMQDKMKFHQFDSTQSFIQGKINAGDYQENQKFSESNKNFNSFNEAFNTEEKFIQSEKALKNSFQDGTAEEQKPSNQKSDTSTNRSAPKKSPWTSNSQSIPSKLPDEHTAMELHRSKSYIVNLIDRALSRELGTIPEERSSKPESSRNSSCRTSPRGSSKKTKKKPKSNEYLQMDGARPSYEMGSTTAPTNKGGVETDLCFEISQALADSLNTSASVPVTTHTTHAHGHTPRTSQPTPQPEPSTGRGEHSHSSADLIYSSGDEPTYVKQLKKLRWGHLKHIQREMRRLEDLERFLDSCGSDNH